ncbi:MAG: hypothetical protein KAU48_06850 [Candidatus Thorarchaeota archaeon]|jgi:cephalosporin hydroxylase|nr:hypothetical protein [Candidatus Thorarchaeota archaeon]
MTNEENTDDRLTVEDIESLTDEFLQEQIDSYIESNPDHVLSEYLRTHPHSYDLMKVQYIISANMPERYQQVLSDYLNEVCGGPTKTTTIWWGRPPIQKQSRMQAPKLQEQYWKASIIALIVSIFFNIFFILNEVFGNH